jgi:hypothetical protein
MTFYQRLKNVQKRKCLHVVFERSLKKGVIDYCWLKSALEENSGVSLITERNKRNIPLPIFKNKPMGRNNEYTYTWNAEMILELRITHRNVEKKGRIR